MGILKQLGRAVKSVVTGEPVYIAKEDVTKAIQRIGLSSTKEAHLLDVMDALYDHYTAAASTSVAAALALAVRAASFSIGEQAAIARALASSDVPDLFIEDVHKRGLSARQP